MSGEVVEIVALPSEGVSAVGVPSTLSNQVQVPLLAAGRGTRTAWRVVRNGPARNTYAIVFSAGVTNRPGIVNDTTGSKPLKAWTAPRGSTSIVRRQACCLAGSGAANESSTMVSCG